MSARLLPRQLGCVITCTNCPATFRTALILVKNTRAAAKREGWIRGGRVEGTRREARSDGTPIYVACIKWSKAADFCPACAPSELAHLAKLQQAKNERALARSAKAKQRIAAQLDQERAAAQGASASP